MRQEAEPVPRVELGVGRPLQGGTVIPELRGSGEVLVQNIHYWGVTSARKGASGPVTSPPCLPPVSAPRCLPL